MPNGRVTKAYCGYLTVVVADKSYLCKTRGTLAYHDVCVGDRVDLTIIDEEHAVVEKILPRTQLLEHPRAANINQVLVVVSLVDPVTDVFLIDKFLVMAAAAGLTPVLCVNKIDLVSKTQLALLEEYRRWYQVCTVSALTGTGLEALRVLLKGAASVLAGPSGVGKTSLLNALVPALLLKTHDVSHKNKHGVHTTRFVEMLQLDDDTFVLDTPGFSNVDLTVEPRELTALSRTYRYRPRAAGFRGVSMTMSRIARSKQPWPRALLLNRDSLRIVLS